MRGRRALLEKAQQKQRRCHHKQRGHGRRPAGAVAAVLVAAAVLHEHAEGAGSAHALRAFLVAFEPSAVTHSAKVAVHFLHNLSAHLRPGTRRKVFLDAHVTVHEIRGDVVERVGAVGVVGRVAAPAIDGPAFVHKHQREENNSYEGYLRTAGDGHRSRITGGGGPRNKKIFFQSSRRQKQSQVSLSSAAFSEAQALTPGVHSAAWIVCALQEASSLRAARKYERCRSSEAGMREPYSATWSVKGGRGVPTVSSVPLAHRQMQTHLALSGCAGARFNRKSARRDRTWHSGGSVGWLSLPVQVGGCSSFVTA